MFFRTLLKKKQQIKVAFVSEREYEFKLESREKDIHLYDFKFNVILIKRKFQIHAFLKKGYKNSYFSFKRSNIRLHIVNDMAARQTYSDTSVDQYSYVTEDQIDSELKCSVCNQPFVQPMVGKQCEHTFCKVCIDNWYQQNFSCPLCRMNTPFKPLTTRIVLSQLDRLLVRCSHCHQNNIERGNFDDHIQHQCRQVNVRCKAADLKCTWTGKRQELVEHSAICPLLQIRPVIQELRSELSAQAYQFQVFMDEMRERFDNLQKQRQQHVPRAQRR